MVRACRPAGYKGVTKGERQAGEVWKTESWPGKNKERTRDIYLRALYFFIFFFTIKYNKI